MLLLGIDLGTSSVKVSVVDSATGSAIATTQFPDTEAPILSPQPGWAEQDPAVWWEQVQQAILKSHRSGKYNPADISAIGIAYQMHGLVLIDKTGKILRNSIIWCDSRAVKTGDQAFEKIGKEKCLTHLLNSPGNFTASKLAWVKEHEPQVYQKIALVLLPGDFIAGKLTGQYTTSISALSEGVFWDFRTNSLSADIFSYYGFEKRFIPTIQDVFSEHGRITNEVAALLSLQPGIPVTYKAGDQPNNALSLNVLEPGEFAATAGTSGVIYGVSDQLTYDSESRINSFAHVNHTDINQRIGVLLCINGTGIMNRWAKNTIGTQPDYAQMNAQAAAIKPGSDGLRVLPFGNGAERMFRNKQIQAHVQGIDLNIHQPAHLYRATQEGIAFAFRYGFDIMRTNGMQPQVIRAGLANMFLSGVFTRCLVNVLQVPVELFQNEGSTGAALGAGIGAGVYKDAAEAFAGSKRMALVEPETQNPYPEIYASWLDTLQKQLN